MNFQKWNINTLLKQDMPCNININLCVKYYTELNLLDGLNLE